MKCQSSDQASSCSTVFCTGFPTSNNFTLQFYVFQGAANANRFPREGVPGAKCGCSAGSDGCQQWGPLRPPDMRSSVHPGSPLRWGQRGDQRKTTYSTYSKFTQESRLETQTPPAQTGTGYPEAELKQSSWAMGSGWEPR